MLTLWKAILLGVIQGATEFLPVSSSGHLVVAQQLLGWSPEGSTILTFDIALHVGTLVSVVAVFWRDCLDMLTGKNWKMVFYLIVATIPAVIVGFTLKDWFAGLFTSVITVAIAWLVTGVVLILTKFVGSEGSPSPSLSPRGRGENSENVGWIRSILIGSAQAVAIIPGISRSGSTIAAGLFLRLEKTAAAKFAFLMSIPAIAGGAILEAKDAAAFPSELILPLIAGFVAAVVTGYICIKWLLRIIKGGRLYLFGIYCLIAGIVTLIVTAL